MAKTIKQDPGERGREDYKKGIYKCPYSPTSKAAKKWQEAQDFASFQAAIDAGYYDDGGGC
jgi:hypothetical protein